MKTKTLLFTAITIYLLFTSTQSVKAQTFNATWGNLFQTTLDSCVLAGDIKGASVSVYSPGQGLWTGVSGNSSFQVPITANMRFGIASNTKLFIATVMLKLQEQGTLSLNDPLDQWLPSFQYVDSTTTIRQLLSNQSGIYDYLNDSNPWGTLWIDSIWADTSRFWTSQEILSTIGAPNFAPGMGYSYSNTNFVLAAMIIEAATGNSWVQNLHTYIFDPLSMNSTFVGAFEAPNGPIANLWVTNWGNGSNDGEISYPMTSLYSTSTAAGGILSTSSDMAIWYSALFSGAIISEASLQEMTNFDPLSKYGLGIWKNYFVDPTTDKAYSHSGSLLGYQSFMWYDVRTKSVICVLTNGGWDDYNALLIPFYNVFYNQYPLQANDAGISLIEGPIGNDCSASETPSVTLKNYGNNVLNTVSINYKIDGGVPAVYNWVGALGINSQVVVTLPSIILASGSHVFTCYSSMPNGASDGYIYNDTIKSDFIVNTAVPFAPLTENFDGAVFPPTGWSLNSSSLDESLFYDWGQTAIAPFNGSYSAAIGNAGYFGANYDLDMPMINISGVSNPALEFEYAYTYQPGYYDSLRVSISSDCGISWQSLFYKGGYSLKTAAATYNYFYPTATQWKHETISLAAYTGEVLIRFRKICGWGNNLYIDNVGIDQSTGIDAVASNEPGIKIYPNPTTGTIYLSEQSNITLIDLSGKLLLEEKNTNQLDLSALPAGMYFLRVGENNNQLVKVIKE